MHLRKTKTAKGRIYLAIVDSYYDKQRKMSRSKTGESLGYLDELEKVYTDPIAHFQKRVDELKDEKNLKQAPISFTFGSIIFFVGLPPRNVLICYATLDRMEKQCCSFITDGEELKNNLLFLRQAT